MKQVLKLLFIFCILPHTILGANTIFTTNSIEGIAVKYVINSNNETVYVGDGTVAINTNTEGVLTIPSEVTYKGVTYTVIGINQYAFQGCGKITYVNLPETICIIGDCAYDHCSSLESIVIPDNVNMIRSLTFSGCTSLNSVSMPSNLDYINRTAFSGCRNIRSIYISDINTWSRILCSNAPIPVNLYNSYNLYNKDGAEIKKITLDDNIGSIADGAFCGYSNLESIAIPETITSFGNNLFRGCKSLAEINIPEHLETIGEATFEGCSSLSEIRVPMTLISIGNSAFKDCSSLSEILIPKTLIRIGSSVFCGCANLKSFTWPDNISTINSEMFGRCSSLSEILMPNVKQIDNGAFTYCNSLKEIALPEGLEIIGDRAFAYCSSLERVTIPSTVTSIGEMAFFDCPVLTNVFVRIQKPFNIAQSVFKKISSGSVEVVINVPYNKLNDYTNYFAGVYSNWNRYNIQEMAPLADDYFKASISYGGVSAETDVLVTNGSPLEVQLGREGVSAFAENTDLVNCVIPATIVGPKDSIFTVKRLGDYLFDNCPILAQLTIPRTVDSIGSQFIKSENINSVYVKWRNSSEVIINTDNFTDLSQHATLYVPAGTKERYAESEIWGRFSQIVESGPISTGDISARYGSKADLPIYLKNNEEIEGLQFKLTLPEGVTVAENDGGLITSTTDRTDGMIIMGSKDPDAENSYLFVLLSLDGNAIAGNEGAIMNVRLNVDNDMSIGLYEIKMTDINLVTVTYETLLENETWGDLTIQDYIVGDVNGDKKVTITDAVGVVNYLLGNASANFIEVAADMNGDNKISITDAVAIVNIILQGNSSVKEWEHWTDIELIPE